MRLLLTLSLTMIALSACAKKGNRTTDENGNCTSGYLEDHNSLSRKARSAVSTCKYSSASTCRMELMDIIPRCDVYQRNHPPGRSCSARDLNTFQTVRIHTSDIHDGCNKLRPLLTTADPTPTTRTYEYVPPARPVMSDKTLRRRYGISETTKLAADLPSCFEIMNQSRTQRAMTRADISLASADVGMQKAMALQEQPANWEKYRFLNTEDKMLQDLQSCVEKYN